jgi:hypothetical protein
MPDEESGDAAAIRAIKIRLMQKNHYSCRLNNDRLYV